MPGHTRRPRQRKPSLPEDEGLLQGYVAEAEMFLAQERHQASASKSKKPRRSRLHPDDQRFMDAIAAETAEILYPSRCTEPGCRKPFQKCEHEHTGNNGRVCCTCFNKKYAHEHYRAWRRERRQALGLDPDS